MEVDSAAHRGENSVIARSILGYASRFPLREQSAKGNSFSRSYAVFTSHEPIGTLERRSPDGCLNLNRQYDVRSPLLLSGSGNNTC